MIARASSDGNPLIDGRGGRRRMRVRLNVVERDGGQEDIAIEVWKGKLYYEESRTILYVA